MISRIFPNQFQQICIISVSGAFTAYCQIIAIVSVTSQFHKFSYGIFGGFLSFQTSVGWETPRFQSSWLTRMRQPLSSCLFKAKTILECKCLVFVQNADADFLSLVKIVLLYFLNCLNWMYWIRARGMANLIKPWALIECRVYSRVGSYIPYARHYNPRFVYFLPHF